jgi:hypothetical protein
VDCNIPELARKLEQAIGKARMPEAAVPSRQNQVAGAAEKILAAVVVE